MFVGSTMSMAPAVEEELPETCFEWADREATRIGFMQGWSHEQEYDYFVVIYTRCNAGTLPGQATQTIANE